MAASSKHSCETSLDLSEPLQESCWFDSILQAREGIELEVTTKVYSGQKWLLFSIPGFGKLQLLVGAPRHSRIPESQIQLAATLFFGSLLSSSVQSKTPEWLITSSSIASNYTVFGNLERPLFGSIVAAHCLWAQEQEQEQERGQLENKHSSPKWGHVEPKIEEVRRTDELRSEVIQMLAKKKSEVKMFVDRNFEAYCIQMLQRDTVGGELEILMASHVLMSTIRVFRFDEKAGDMLLIAEYGKQMYGTYHPINILYKGDAEEC